MIFTLQVDLSTRKTPIDFQMQRSKDASAAAILTFRAEIVPFQSLSRVFTDFNIAGWSKHKEDTCWFSDATVKEHARGGHFSDFSIRKCSFPTIISSIYRLICMIFTLQVDLSTRKTPIDFQMQRSEDAPTGTILMTFRAKNGRFWPLSSIYGPICMVFPLPVDLSTR